MHLVLLVVALVLAPCATLALSPVSPCSKGDEAARSAGWLCSSAASVHLLKRAPLRAVGGILTMLNAMPATEGMPDMTIFSLISSDGKSIVVPNLRVLDLEQEIARSHEGDRAVETLVVDEGSFGSVLHAIRLGNSVYRATMTSNVPAVGFTSSNYTRTDPIAINMLVLRASFSNQTLSASCTQSAVQSFMGNMTATRSVARTYGETALCRVTTTVTVSPTVQTIPLAGGTGGTCNTGTTPYDWFDAVKTAHSGTYNYTSYDIIAVVLPYPSGCPYGGIASVSNGCGSGGGCGLNLNLECSYRVIAHETGHNLGWRHSGDISYSYGDSSCLMGSRVDFW